MLNAIRLPPGGSSTVHIYTQTIHRTTHSTQTIHRRTQFTNFEKCGPCPVFERYTLAFALHLRKKHRKTSVRVEKPIRMISSKRWIWSGHVASHYIYSIIVYMLYLRSFNIKLLRDLVSCAKGTNECNFITK